MVRRPQRRWSWLRRVVCKGGNLALKCPCSDFIHHGPQFTSYPIVTGRWWRSFVPLVLPPTDLSWTPGWFLSTRQPRTVILRWNMLEFKWKRKLRIVQKVKWAIEKRNPAPPGMYKTLYLNSGINMRNYLSTGAVLLPSRVLTCICWIYWSRDPPYLYIIYHLKMRAVMQHSCLDVS